MKTRNVCDEIVAH